MVYTKISTVLLAVSFTMGCSSGKNTDPAPPPAKTVFDPLTQNLNKAKDVQKAVDTNTDATRRAVDPQEHGDSPR